MRDNHIKGWNCQCLQWILKQALFRRTIWRRSAWLTSRKHDRTQNEKVAMMTRKPKYQSSHKMRCRLPLIASKKVKRRSCQTLDHLETYRLLEQKCWEWCIKMWVATVEFMNAFDLISHQSLWKALEKCGIESQYIRFLRRLHAKQKATFLKHRDSDEIEIKKEANEAGPLIVQFALQHRTPNGAERRRDALRQKIKGMGACFGDSESDCFTNLRFEDDVFLFSTLLEQLQKMMCDFKQSTERIGLKIHSDKTRMLALRYYLRLKVQNILGNQ